MRGNRGARWAAAMAVAAVVVLSSGLSYVAGLRTGTVQPVVARSPAPTFAAPMPTAPSLPPVRYANPFDPTEVFEFPAGTSERQAHDSVAELLLNRARQRLAATSGLLHART